MTRRSVLVVEDDERLREYFRTALAFAGYSVSEAKDGLDALQTIDSAAPDLIVLDLMLPQVTGFDVLADVRTQAHTRRIPVVVVTGSSDENLDNLPVECVLRKPITPEQLLDAVQRCLHSLPEGDAGDGATE